MKKRGLNLMLSLQSDCLINLSAPILPNVGLWDRPQSCAYDLWDRPQSEDHFHSHFFRFSDSAVLNLHFFSAVNIYALFINRISFSHPN